MKTETETNQPLIIVEQEDDGYIIASEHSAFVECVSLQPIEDMKDNFLVVFSLKDGSEYAYFSKEFTLANLFSSLFTQQTLSLGKWLNSYIKPLGSVYQSKKKDASLGLRVSDRFPREALTA
jgi:hypothetical protein